MRRNFRLQDSRFEAASDAARPISRGLEVSTTTCHLTKGELRCLVQALSRIGFDGGIEGAVQGSIKGGGTQKRPCA